MFNPFRRCYAEENGDGAGGGGGESGAAASAPVLLNPDGTLGENWHTALGDEFTPHAAQLATYKDVKGLAKSMLHFRGNGPSYPADGATPEDVARFHSLAQVPAEGTPTAYGITLPDGASELDKSVLDRVSKVAKDSHMPAPAFKAVVAEYQRIQQEEGQKLADLQVANQKAAQDALVAEWRGNFEANKSTVRHLTSTLAAQVGLAPEDPAFAQLMDNPAYARIMLEVAKLTKEDSISTPAGLGDLRSAQQKVDAIMDGTDPIWGKKYTDGTREEQVAAYSEVRRLLGETKK